MTFVFSSVHYSMNSDFNRFALEIKESSHFCYQRLFPVHISQHQDDTVIIPSYFKRSKREKEST